MSVFTYSSDCPRFGSEYKKLFKSEVIESMFAPIVLDWGDVDENTEPPFKVVYMDDKPVQNMYLKTRRGFPMGNAHVIYDKRIIERYGLKINCV